MEVIRLADLWYEPRFNPRRGTLDENWSKYGSRAGECRRNRCTEKDLCRAYVSHSVPIVAPAQDTFLRMNVNSKRMQPQSQRRKRSLTLERTVEFGGADPMSFDACLGRTDCTNPVFGV